MRLREIIFIVLALVAIVALLSYGLQPTPTTYTFTGAPLRVQVVETTPTTIKCKVDKDGSLILDIQKLGTSPLPNFDMSEWKSSLDAWRENPSEAEVERLKKRRVGQ